MVYHDSWRERPALHGHDMLLASLPSYVNLVALSFVRPDLRYAHDLDLSATGLSYTAPGPVVRDAIARLKARNPKVRVLLSVGGAAPEERWRRLDEAALASLVRDLGADGVDIDFEPADPACRRAAAVATACASDAAWRDLVRRIRRVLPRPYIVSVAAWSVGAYGEGGFAAARPPSPWTGVMIPLLRSPEAASIDLVTLCAYDAGPAFDPLRALAAYRQYWKGPIVLGVETAFKGAGGPFYTPAQVTQLARTVSQIPGTGMMIYSLLEPVDPAVPAQEHPDGRALAEAACRGLSRNICRVEP